MLSTFDLPRPVHLLAGLIAGASLLACGDDSTGPEGPGLVAVAMTDEPEPAASPARASAQAVPAGTFTADVQVEISTDGDSWVEVLPTQEASVTLQAAEEVVIVSDVEVAGGSYAFIRVTMSGASAQVTQIDGTTLQPPAAVTVAGGEELVLETQTFPFTVDADTDQTILIDLDSEEWITETSVDAGGVSSAIFEAAVAEDIEAVRR